MLINQNRSIGTIDFGNEKIREIDNLKTELMEMKKDMSCLRTKEYDLESKINETLGSMTANNMEISLHEEGKQDIKFN